MRLALISGAWPPQASGEAANTFHLARRLATRDVDVHVVTELGARHEGSGCTVHPVMPRWTWAEKKALLAELGRIGPDAILLMHLGAIYGFHPMITFLPTWAKRALPGVRFVTRFENPLSGTRPGPGLLARAARATVARLEGPGVDWASGTLLRDSDAVIALCAYHERLLRDQRSDTVVTVIPPCPNVTVPPDPDGALRLAGRRTLKLGATEVALGFLGYLYPNKGVETLLRAFAALQDRGVSTRLVVLGGGIGVGIDVGGSYPERMRALAAELGVADRVMWTGPFSPADPDVAPRVHAIDAFVFPLDNGIHLNNSSLASVAALGKPFVGTVGPDMDGAFVEGENVLLCPPRDPDALAAVLERLVDDAQLRERLARGASALAATWFDWDRALDRTLSLLG